jgi:hypothetical protein
MTLVSTTPYTTFLAELRRYDVKLSFEEMAILTAAADARLFGDDEAAIADGDELLAELGASRFARSAVDRLSELLLAIEPAATLMAV